MSETWLTLAVIAVELVAGILFLRHVDHQKRLTSQENPSEPLTARLPLQPSRAHLESMTDVFEGTVSGFEVRVVRKPMWLSVSFEVPAPGGPSEASWLTRTLAMPEPLETAMMSAERRALLQALLDQEVRFQKGRATLTRSWPGRRWLGRDDASLVSDLATSLSALFAPVEDVPAALLANLEEARDELTAPANVQSARRNLRMLVTHFPSSRACERARSLMRDVEDAQIQAILAMGRGGDGTAMLVAMLMTTAGEAGSLVPAIERLGKMRHAAALPGLLRQLDSDHHSVVRAALDALRKLKAPGTARAIFAVMDHTDEGIRLAAVEALARCGDAWAGAALHDWAARNRKDRAVASAARLTSARLKDQYGDVTQAEAGALSLNDTQSEAGTLSLAERSETGAVSLPEETT